MNYTIFNAIIIYLIGFILTILITFKYKKEFKITFNKYDKEELLYLFIFWFISWKKIKLILNEQHFIQNLNKERIL